MQCALIPCSVCQRPLWMYEDGKSTYPTLREAKSEEVLAGRPQENVELVPPDTLPRRTGKERCRTCLHLPPQNRKRPMGVFRCACGREFLWGLEELTPLGCGDESPL